MAPERLLGKEVKSPCDIWSIGVIIYILICGKPPFSGRTKEELKDSIF